jgi:hypothetical protein
MIGIVLLAASLVAIELGFVHREVVYPGSGRAWISVAARDALVAGLTMAVVVIPGVFRLFAHRGRLRLSAKDIRARHPRGRAFYILAGAIMLTLALGFLVLVLWFVVRVADHYAEGCEGSQISASAGHRACLILMLTSGDAVSTPFRSEKSCAW